jgi:hypothetical protein
MGRCQMSQDMDHNFRCHTAPTHGMTYDQRCRIHGTGHNSMFARQIKHNHICINTGHIIRISGRKAFTFVDPPLVQTRVDLRVYRGLY